MRKSEISYCVWQNWFIAILVFVSCSVDKTKTEIDDLTCEYLSNPIGIDVVTPRLSWKMRSSERGAQQTAYRILAATNEELLQNENPDLWDSGKINSCQSVHVEYKGKPLKSGMEIFWKVRVWDQKGKILDWSQTAQWEMGLLNEKDWQGKWIGATQFQSKEDWKLPAPFFRKEIDIQKKIKKARAYISGLGYYELYINGEKVGDHVLSPNQTNYDRRAEENWNEPRIGNMTTTVLYETYDITSALLKGENAIGVILGNGWYIQADRPDDKPLWYDTPRVLVQIEIEYEDGTKQLVCSDENWKTSTGPIIYNGLHSGEIYDARLELSDWNRIRFNDTHWENAVAIRPPSGELKAQMSPSDRVTRIIKPVSISEIEKGVYRFDMGEMISGWARLKISGEKGSKINLKFIEELGPTYGQTDTYILKGEGTEIWEPRFTWHAFRFVEVRSTNVPLTIDNLEGCVVNTDVQSAGNFSCSDTLLNRILKNYRSTQLGNMHGGVPSDCPHRERRGYTGDGQISAMAAIYNFGMPAFYTKWIRDIQDAQNHETGYVPNTAPYQDGGGGTAWGAAYIIIPWYMYLYYADERILQEHYSGMKHWIEYLNNSLDQHGILRDQGLGEWVPPETVRIPPDFVNTCYYFHCCRLMKNVAEILNINEDRDYFEKLSSMAGENINKLWFNSENSSYSIGRQGANIFPLGFDIVEKNNSIAVFTNLVDNLMANEVHFDTGILATPLLLDVLTKMGRVDLAWTLMAQRDFPSFGYMIEKGATTIWETWQGDASHSHPMFGSVCHWFFQYLGGISPDPGQPGFKHSVIKPFPVRSLDFVNTSYPSMYGTIESNWKFEGDDYFLDVTIPSNSCATIYILAENRDMISEGENKISIIPNIQYLDSEGNFEVYQVNSGKYRFCSKNAKKLLPKPILPAPVIYPGDALVFENDSVLVNIVSANTETEIYYTLNGQEPDSNSLRFEKPFYISKLTTIKAKSFAAGYLPDYTKTADIHFINPEINGLTFHYYEGKWTSLPDFPKFNEKKSGTVYEFGLNKIYPEKDEFALMFEGKINIQNTGEYMFYVKSNDGSCLYVNNQLVVNHDGLHGADLEKTGKIHLNKGIYPIKLNYFQAGGGMFLRVQYSGPDIEKQEIPAMNLYQ